MRLYNNCDERDVGSSELIFAIVTTIIIDDKNNKNQQRYTTMTTTSMTMITQGALTRSRIRERTPSPPRVHHPSIFTPQTLNNKIINAKKQADYFLLKREREKEREYDD